MKLVSIVHCLSLFRDGLRCLRKLGGGLKLGREDIMPNEMISLMHRPECSGTNIDLDFTYCFRPLNLGFVYLTDSKYKHWD